MTRHTRQWFIERISRRIIRPEHGSCNCPSCRGVEKCGLIIADKQHADYLYLCQQEMGLEYQDIKI